MPEENKIKENFLFFLKSFATASFLILIVEAAQLILKLNYYHSYSPYKETLKMAGLILIIFIFSGAIISAALTLIVLGNDKLKGLFRAIIETLCVTAILLVWIPAIIIVFTKDFPPVMQTFWLSYHGLIPLAILTATIALRLLFKNGFKNVFANLRSMLWKPLLAIAVFSFIWIVLTASAGRADKTASLAPDLNDASGKAKPNIILITFDSLGASDMSLHGYHLDTTPAWEALAKESFVFDRAHSNSNKTIPSVVSILTGKYPWTHGLFTEGRDRVEKEAKGEHLAALLPDHHTSAIVASTHIFPPFIGLGKEFDYAIWTFHQKTGLIAAIGDLVGMALKERPSPMIIPVTRHLFFLNRREDGDARDNAPSFSRAKEFLERRGPRPFFLWAHIFPPHHPYSPDTPFLGKFVSLSDTEEKALKTIPTGPYDMSIQPLIDKLRLRYNETILFSDHRLSLFITYLKEAGLYEDSIIIVSSDHGEIFERGWTSHHSPSLLEAETHVPLLIRLPGQHKAGRVSARAEGVDIAPTILDLIGKPIPKWMEGESLVPYMKGERSDADKTKFSFVHFDPNTFKEFSNNDTVEAVAAYRGDYKLLYSLSGGAALYNIAKDKDEEFNIAKERPEIVERIKNDILEAIKKGRRAE